MHRLDLAAAAGLAAPWRGCRKLRARGHKRCRFK